MALYQLSRALTFEYILASSFYSDKAPLMNFFSCPSDPQCLLGSKLSMVVHTSDPSPLEAESGGAQVPCLPELFTNAFPAKPSHDSLIFLCFRLAWNLSCRPGLGICSSCVSLPSVGITGTRPHVASVIIFSKYQNAQCMSPKCTSGQNMPALHASPAQASCVFVSSLC